MTGFLNQEADGMIYLTYVVRGLLDPVFSFKDEHKSEQDFKIKYNMYRYWNAVSVGYAKYLTIIPRARMGSESIAAEWAIDSEAMRARGIIVLVKSN